MACMWRLLVVAVVLGAGLVAASSGSRVTRVRLAERPEVIARPTIPYRSIGDVMVGMRRSYVNRLMGVRGQQIRKPNGHVDVWYSGAEIEVWFDHGVAKNVSTRTGSYRLLPSNLGVASTRAAIMRAYRVRCFPDIGIPMPCVTPTRTIAGVPRTMTFWLKGGRTVSFDVGIVSEP